MSTSEGARTGVPHFVLNLARIGFGLLFMQHGAQKLFAVLGRAEAAETFSQLWFAGVLEFWVGGLVVVGLFTRPAALLLALEMAIAYLQRHAPRGWVPIENGGEQALMFGLFFLFVAVNGGGSFSVDGFLANRKSRRLG